jgi:hypothetical protein
MMNKSCIDCCRELAIKGRGLCNTCYTRWYRTQNPEMFRRNEKKQREKPASKVRICAYNSAYKQRKKAYRKAKQIELRLKVETIKEASPCLDCDNYFPAICMDFHHRDPATKLKDVSVLVMRSALWETIAEEIAKCDLICSNCHRIRTKAQRELLAA